MSASTLSPAVVAELKKYGDTLALLHQGAIDADKVFKPFRLVHGVYGQRQGGGNQMVRIKLPYGRVTPDQLRALAAVTERYGHGIAHITTRQAIQLHYVPLDDTPDLLRQLEEAGMTTREACGNAVRAVVGSPRIGTLPEEPFAVDPYQEAVFRHFLRGPLSASLPRKFKIGFSSSDADRLAQSTIQDIGITAVVVDGRQGFRVVAAGALGSSPQAPVLVRACCAKPELIPLCEAILRVFHKHGDRQNRAKARLKFVLRSKGEAAFLALVEEELRAVVAEGVQGRELPDRLPEAAPSPIPAAADPVEQAWRRWNVRAHREPGLAVVSVTVPRGDLAPARLRELATLAEVFSQGDVRTSNDQNLLLRRVPIPRLGELFARLAVLGHAGHAHSIVDVLSCPGAATCQLGLTRSKGLAELLETALADLSDPGVRSTRINISGCPNSCGQHHIGGIGLHGAAAKIGDKLVPHYVLLIGGRDEGDRVHHAAMICRIPARRVAAVIRQLATWYLAERQEGEDLTVWLRRQAGSGLDKAAAAAARNDLKARIAPLCAYQEATLEEQDLCDLGSTQLFSESMQELGAGECMS